MVLGLTVPVPRSRLGKRRHRWNGSIVFSQESCWHRPPPEPRGRLGALLAETVVLARNANLELYSVEINSIPAAHCGMDDKLCDVRMQKGTLVVVRKPAQLFASRDPSSGFIRKKRVL